MKELRTSGIPPLRPKRKLRRTIYILPSIFTVGNIFAGFLALIATLNGEYEKAAIAIGIAVILDGLDGRIARLVNVTSDFGVQLDSLADVISFGIAPAVLVYSWGLEDFGRFARFSAFVFLICGVMRLARFNMQIGELKHFAGLPIPAAAGFIAATVHFFPEPPDNPLFKPAVVGATYLTALLMISTIRYPSLKRLNLGQGKSHLVILTLASLVAGIFFYSRYALLILAYSYLLSGPLARMYQFSKYRFGHTRRVAPRDRPTG